MRSLLALVLAALSLALAQKTLILALADLMVGIRTDASGLAWGLTGYLIAAAGFPPISGRPCDMFRKRRLLVIALAVYAAGPVASALGSGVTTTVVGRILQRVGGGIFPDLLRHPQGRVPGRVGLRIDRADLPHGRDRRRAWSDQSGLILDHASYHLTFWLHATMTAVIVVAAVLRVQESPNRIPARVDGRSGDTFEAGGGDNQSRNPADRRLSSLTVSSISRANPQWIRALFAPNSE